MSKVVNSNLTHQCQAKGEIRNFEIYNDKFIKIKIHDLFGEKAYHVNLVRRGYEEQSADSFSQLLQPAFANRFRRATWEDVYGCLQKLNSPSLNRLSAYLEQKTAQLRRAFKTSSP